MITRHSNYDLTSHNTFGIRAIAREFIAYNSVEDLVSLAPFGPFLHIGSGANLLFATDKISIPILKSGIESIEINHNESGFGLIRAGAAIDWDEFVATTLSKGLYGLENLSIIPGTVGSSAVQNIGAYGAEAKDFIVAVDTVDLSTGTTRRFSAAECDYAYRFSAFKRQEMKKYVVTHVTFRLSSTFTPNLRYQGLKDLCSPNPTAFEVRSAVIDMRRSKLPDPAVLGNAGSFFTNPIVNEETALHLAEIYPDMPRYNIPDGRVKLSAAWLIDRAGWKGKTIGRAGVYNKQPLVIVNLGGATGEEILKLATTLIKDIKERFGIELHPEVNVISA